jgi:serine/threonine protein kinase
MYAGCPAEAMFGLLGVFWLAEVLRLDQHIRQACPLNAQFRCHHASHPPCGLPVSLHSAPPLACRYVQPENILYTNNTGKDLAECKAHELTWVVGGLATARELGNAGTYMGTLGYIAPEVTPDGGIYNELVDSYSVGRVLAMIM